MLRQHTFGIQVTNRCPLTCGHCITSSSNEESDDLSEAEVDHLIRQVVGVVDHVCFTGGEPIVWKGRIERSIVLAKELGLKTSVMTSAFWAKTDKSTKLQLDRLCAAGLDGLGISLDKFHSDYQSDDYAFRAAREAVGRGLEVSVRVVVRKGEAFGDIVKARLEPEGILVQVCPISRLGRAESLSDDVFEWGESLDAAPCRNVKSASMRIGNKVTSCCGPGKFMNDTNPLVLGDVSQEPLREILNRSWGNPVRMATYVYGPGGIARLMRAEHPNEAFVKSTSSDPCNVCLSMTNNRRIVELMNDYFSREDVYQKMLAALMLKEISLLRSA
ncbi:radical SAM protein [uncultured Gemmobacter sp.]|uniref:radical SAM protein n=1 Tax=uncultured Gemmobacter sp. TaxID=1095917 RepID=UPI000AC71FCE|nr:radical SAM protein [uncultured Gemmobacter sp.]